MLIAAVAIVLAGAGLALLLGTEDAEDPDIAAVPVLLDAAIVAPTFTDGPAPIDINTASEADLIRLHGIGPVLAERIVAYRNEHGPFSSIDDLKAVQGIGDATVDDLRGRATAGPSDQ